MIDSLNRGWVGSGRQLRHILGGNVVVSLCSVEQQDLLKCVHLITQLRQ